MRSNQRTEYLTRDHLMKALSDDEVASVATAETAARLDAGEEYLDLEHLDLGVCRATSTSGPMGRLLPRKAVHAKTWTKLLSRIEAFPTKRSHPIP